MQLVEQGKGAVSAVDLIERLKKEMNKTTVYRILERLEKDGLVHSFTGRDGLKWYAKGKTCSSGHHQNIYSHFQCKLCGKVECLPIEMEIPKLQNYTIEAVEILSIGQCQACSSHANSDEEVINHKQAYSPLEQG